MRKQVVITLDAIDGEKAELVRMREVSLHVDGCDGNPFTLRIGDTLTILLPEDSPKDPNAKHLTADLKS